MAIVVSDMFVVQWSLHFKTTHETMKIHLCPYMACGLKLKYNTCSKQKNAGSK